MHSLFLMPGKDISLNEYLELVRVDGEGVGLGVENPLVQIHLVLVCKQEIEVLESLPEEEGLHHVPGPCVHGVPDVADGGIASTNLAVSFYALRIQNIYDSLFKK